MNLRSSKLHVAILARQFAFRQGLWTEDLRIPPGQECSNGSLILFAVVLWRSFLYHATGTFPSEVEGDKTLAQEL